MDSRIGRFSLGRVVATRGVLSEFEISEISALLDRHVSGDWGDLDSYDLRANERALKNDTRILSSYSTQKGKVWIITEADRSSTTALLPEEY